MVNIIYLFNYYPYIVSSLRKIASVSDITESKEIVMIK